MTADNPMVVPTYLVTNEDGSESVGFDELADAMFAAGHDHAECYEVNPMGDVFSSLAHYWREWWLSDHDEGDVARILEVEHGAGNADQLILEVTVYTDGGKHNGDEDGSN